MSIADSSSWFLFVFVAVIICEVPSFEALFFQIKCYLRGCVCLSQAFGSSKLSSIYFLRNAFSGQIGGNHALLCSLPSTPPSSQSVSTKRPADAAGE